MLNPKVHGENETYETVEDFMEVNISNKGRLRACTLRRAPGTPVRRAR